MMRINKYYVAPTVYSILATKIDNDSTDDATCARTLMIFSFHIKRIPIGKYDCKSG